MRSLLVIYTKTGCPYCEAAKKHFSAEETPFEEVNLSVHPERIPEIKQLTNSTKVPVIVDNGKVTVGFNGGG
ncbi:MAG: Uxx-star family glutaredoxin-like (seleno)protein [Deltaproteobacteria bacterium]